MLAVSEEEETREGSSEHRVGGRFQGIPFRRARSFDAVMSIEHLHTHTQIHTCTRTDAQEFDVKVIYFVD